MAKSLGVTISARFCVLGGQNEEKRSNRLNLLIVSAISGAALEPKVRWGRRLDRRDEAVAQFEDPVHMSTEESEFYPTERFFNSGERQRLVKSLMNGVLWQNEVSKFGRECKYGSQYEYLFSTTMAGAIRAPAGRSRCPSTACSLA